MGKQETIRILIAEDDFLVGRSTATLLRTMGYTVIGQALNGQEAVEMARSLRPDVILMDIKMPIMDGIEATQHIHETCPTPVVALTAHATPEVIERAIAAGVGAYLTKPANPQEIERAINVTIAQFDNMVELRRLNTELQAEIAERKRAEEALKESEERYRELVEKAGIAILIGDREGGFKYFNETFAEWFGYSVEEMKQQSIRTLVHPDDVDRVMESHTGRIRGREVPSRYEFRGVGKDGSIRYLEVDAVELKEGDSIIGTSSYLWDITERKRAEDALRESEEKYRTILENIEDGYFEVDIAGNFTFFNDSLCRLLGYSEDELMGMNNRQYMDDENAKKVYQTFNTVYRTGKPAEAFDWEVIKKDGSRRFVEASVSLMRDSTGEPAGFRGVVRDITERRRAAEEIRQRNRELAALNAITATMMQSALNLKEVLQLTADGVVQGLGCNTGLIFLLDEKEGIFRGSAVSTRARILNRLNAIIGLPLVQIKCPARSDFNEAIGNLLAGRTTIKRDLHELVGPLLSKPVCSAMQRLLDSRSFFAMPLLAKGKTVGGIVASTAEELSEADVAKLMTFANQAAIAIENAQLFKETRQRSEELAALNVISQDITSSLDLDETLQRIVDSTRQLTGARRSRILLVNPQARQLLKDVNSGYHPEEKGTYDYERFEQGISGWVACEKRSALVPDVLADERSVGRSRAASARHGTKSVLVSPLMVRGEVIGTLSAVNLREDPTFTAEVMALVEQLAAQAAIAIENARLYEETRQRALEQETLREAALALTTALDRNQVIGRILAQLQQVVPYDSASVQLLRGNQMEIVGGRGFPNLPDLLGISFPADGDNPNREVIHTRASFIVDDAPAVYEVFQEDPHRQAAIRSWLGVPMLVGEQLVGMIALDKREPGFYTPRHARLAEAFAAQAAVAIENARLFEETQQRVAELDALRRTSLQLTSSLDLAAVLDSIAENALSLVGATNCHLYLYDETSETFTFGAALWENGRRDAAVKMPRRDGLTALVAHEGQALVINDATRHPFYATPETRKWGLHAIASFPLKRGGRVVGVFSIAFLTPHTFSKEELRVLGLLTDQAAVAIENARLHTETQRRLQEQIVLREAGEVISSALDPEIVLTRIAEQMGRAVDATSACICSYEPETMTYITLAEYVGPQACAREQVSDPGTIYQEEDSKLIETLRVGQYYIDHIDDSDLTEAERALMQQYGAQTILYVPLWIKGRFLGYAELWESRRRREFTSEEITLCQDIAQQAAVAMENARLFSEAEQRATELSTMLEAARAVSSTLDLEQVLALIAEEMVKVTGVAGCTLSRWDREADAVVTFTEWRQRRLEDTDEPGTSYALDDLPATRAVLEKRQPISIRATDPDADPAKIALLQKNGSLSLLMLPLVVGERVIGLVELDETEHEREFTDAEIHLCQALADQAAVAIENARLFEEEKRRSTQLALINEVGEKAASILDSDKLMQEVTHSIQESFNYYNVALFLLDEGRRELALRAIAGGFEHAVPGEYRQSIDQGIAGFVTRTGISWLADDVSKDPHYIKGFSEEILTESELCVPVQLGDKVIGVLDMQSVHLNDFEQADVVVMEAVADRIAVALENARLFEEEKRRSTQLALINEVGEKAASILDSDTIMQEVTRSIQESFNYYNVALFLLDEECREVVVQAVAGGFEHVVPGEYRQSLDEGIIGLVVRTGESYLANDISKDPYYVEGFLEEALNKSELCVPVKLGDKVIGVLDMQSVHLNDFDHADVMAMEAVADRLAMGIQNARLYEEMAGLYDVGLAVTSALELDKTLKAIHEQVNRLMSPDTFYIALYDEARGELRFDIFVEEGEWLPKFTKKLDEGGLTTWIVQSRKSLFIGDFEKESPPVTPGQVGKPEIQSWLGFPLLVKGKVVGVISVQSFRPHAFTEGNKRTLSAFANQAAIAIENAHLFEEIEERRMYLEGVLREAPDAIVTLDDRFQVVEWNAGAERLFEYSREEALGQHLDHLVTNPDVFEEAPGFTQRALGGKALSPTETVRYRKDGSPVDVIVAGSPILVGDEVIGVVAIYTDITERVRAEREIEKRRVYLEGVLGAAPDAIVTLDAHHRIVEWNPGAERLFGHSQEEVAGKNIDHVVTRPDVFEEASRLMRKVTGGGEVPPTEAIRYRKDGSPVDVIVAASPILVRDEFIGVVAVYTDITARKRMEETLRALALVDDLTNLYNRRGFLTLAQQQLKTADRAKRRMVLLFADFDGLKQINDAFGHAEGDRALIEVANALRETFRESDIVARIGGDEFVVLAIETDGFPAEILATRLQGNLEARNARGDLRYKLSLSVGLARYDPERPCSIDDLLTQADRAMYEKKRGDTPG